MTWAKVIVVKIVTVLVGLFVAPRTALSGTLFTFIFSEAWKLSTDDI